MGTANRVRMRIPYLPHCRVYDVARQVERAIRSLSKSLRRLRYDRMDCSACPEGADCPLREELALQVENAASELENEWGML